MEGGVRSARGAVSAIMAAGPCAALPEEGLQSQSMRRKSQ